jgi:RNA polymerase sigma-70 factor (ECF subfamily)
VELEQALLERAQAGDADAFSRLVTLHREAVYRAAYWVLKDQELALDATQEAFLKAFRYIARFERRSSFRTWVRRIATNTALDKAAKRGRDPVGQGLPSDDVVRDRRAAPVGDALERRERRELVRAAIEELPPAQRAAVLLRDVEGLSYAEIADELGIPKGTVMSRIHAGRQNLRGKLEAVLGPRAQAIREARAAEEGSS